MENTINTPINDTIEEAIEESCTCLQYPHCMQHESREKSEFRAERESNTDQFSHAFIHPQIPACDASMASVLENDVKLAQQAHDAAHDIITYAIKDADDDAADAYLKVIAMKDQIDYGHLGITPALNVQLEYLEKKMKMAKKASRELEEEKANLYRALDDAERVHYRFLRRVAFVVFDFSSNEHHRPTREPCQICLNLSTQMTPSDRSQLQPIRFQVPVEDWDPRTPCMSTSPYSEIFPDSSRNDFASKRKRTERNRKPDRKPKYYVDKKGSPRPRKRTKTPESPIRGLMQLEELRGSK